MKYFITLIFLLFNSVIFSQNESTRYNLENSVTNVFSKVGDRTTITLNANGENSLSFNVFKLKSNTNYLFKYQNSITFNEFLQKTNIECNDFFMLHLFNRSFLRSISSDNSVGLGYGIDYDENPKLDISLSYAILYQHTEYDDTPKTNVIRHSIRANIKHTNNLFNLNLEYYFQPNVKHINDYILYGIIRVKFLPKRKLNFIIQDDINYRTTSNVTSIHNITFGLNYSIGGIIKGKM